MHFDKLHINIENCYGIAKLDDVLILKTKDDGPRMVIIYAPNGTMKSSLAKVFKKIGKGEVIENNIWGDEPSLEITCDGTPIQETGLTVEVFDPLKDEEQTRVDTILVSDEYLRQKYADISKNNIDLVLPAVFERCPPIIERGYGMETELLPWEELHQAIPYLVLIFDNDKIIHMNSPRTDYSRIPGCDVRIREKED